MTLKARTYPFFRIQAELFTIRFNLKSCQIISPRKLECKINANCSQHLIKYFFYAGLENAKRGERQKRQIGYEHSERIKEGIKLSQI